MALNARNMPQKNNGPRQPAMEAGTYPARLVQVIDFGVQEQRPYKGVAKPPCQTAWMTYEFLDEFCIDEEGQPQEDKPRWLGEELPIYSLEADLAKSTKRYYALDPEEVHGGDFTLLVTSTCMVTINQYPDKKNPGEFKNGISSVTAMRPKEAAKAPELVNEPKVFVIDNPDLEVFKSLPEWMQKKIQGGLEFAGSPLDEALQGPVKPVAKAPAAKPKPNRQAPQQGAMDEQNANDDDDVPLDEDGNPIW
ncbi:hypothetical protein D3C84_148110 [compost metagenome]